MLIPFSCPLLRPSTGSWSSPLPPTSPLVSLGSEHLARGRSEERAVRARAVAGRNPHGPATGLYPSVPALAGASHRGKSLRFLIKNLVTVYMLHRGNNINFLALGAKPFFIIRLNTAQWAGTGIGRPLRASATALSPLPPLAWRPGVGGLVGRGAGQRDLVFRAHKGQVL